jgi:mRNA-degrading endonuclease YafQ of YafQ-DinJ toxin-antitoxin module
MVYLSLSVSSAESWDAFVGDQKSGMADRLETLPQNRQIDSNQLQIDPSELSTQSVLPGSTKDHHLTETVSGELEEHVKYQSLVTSHLRDGLYLDWPM